LLSGKVIQLIELHFFWLVEEQLQVITAGVIAGIVVAAVVVVVLIIVSVTLRRKVFPFLYRTKLDTNWDAKRQLSIQPDSTELENNKSGEQSKNWRKSTKDITLTNLS